MDNRAEQPAERREEDGGDALKLEDRISRTSQLRVASAIAADADDLADESDGERRLAPGQKISGILHSLISQAHACRYEFSEYFVAWQGVLTVAFSGIPPSICELKWSINSQLGGCVAGENPGSKWPKVSLGCLRDGVSLSLDQLRRLRQICSEERHSLAGTAAAAEPVVVDELSVVLYANCCLEKTITSATIPLALPFDLSGPSAEETALVRQVLDEFAPENVESYHHFASKAGNRSAHYRNFRAGATLVHFLKSVPVALASFRARVDSELPGMYDWFRDDSLHITVRSLF